ncbi:MAG: calcium/sodium antiporter [Saprospiraceae bacterium]|nr:calcium/sodium antiporter [Saprospiraceae bacterium]
MPILMLIVGLVMLVIGAELLVKGASKLAAAMGISPLVIGLTIVAFGTSSPEMAVSVMSSLNGSSEIAVGNVVGSNIFNVLFILGISGIITPLVVAQQLVRLDVPLMIGSSLLMMMMAWNGSISQIEGIVLFAGIIGYTFFLIRQSRKEKSKSVKAEYNAEFGKEIEKKPTSYLINALLVIFGLVILVLGSRWLVNGAVEIAQKLGVSDLIVGLTIVAAGTSMPEVATSVIASIRGERDIAVGNVVGSNIFNILAVLGLTATVSQGGLPVSTSALSFDIPVMIAVALACLPIFFTGNIISRWEGFVFLGYYVAYTVYLILSASHHDALPFFSHTMMWFVVPITVLTLIVVTVRTIRKREKI